MSEFQSLLQKQLRSLGKTILLGYGLTLSIYIGSLVLEDYTHRKEVLTLTQETFQDYIVYESIVPDNTNVNYQDAARFQSNMEVIKIPEGGLHIEWKEIIECDTNLNDGIDKFIRYATVTASERTFLGTKVVKSVPNTKGWPVISKNTLKNVKYPPIDANCRLESIMTQTHKFGIKKVYIKTSELVYVRNLTNEQ